jgi:hypothetical protein
MAGTANTAYSARFQLPDLVERGLAATLTCPVYRDGALVAPTADGSTCTIVDSAGATVTTPAVSVTGSIAAVSWTPDATQALGDNYQVRWSLVISAATYAFRNELAVVRAKLYCPITDADLFRVAPSLDPNGSPKPATRRTHFQATLDEAWVQIQLRLIEAGKRPYLVISPSAFREAALQLALALVFEDLSSRASPEHGERAATHRANFEGAWSRLNFRYDETDAGTNATDAREAARGTTWLGSRGTYYRGFR